MFKNPDIRPSPIAGQWYPANPAKLAQTVDAYIQAADLPPMDGEIIGIIVPHAGHIYSGPVAGYAFAAIQALTSRTVAVVAPLHQPHFDPVLTSGHAAYQTPLGEVEIDRELVAALDRSLENQLGIGLTPLRNDREHALEIELPFLQRALSNPFKLIPIMLRATQPGLIQTLGLALADILPDQNPLLVASTDLSHFYPQETAEKLDREMLRRIADLDPEAVLNAEQTGVGFACGRGAVAAVLWAAQKLGATQVQILKYATSGAISGDYHQVVGYGAAIITR